MFWTLVVLKSKYPISRRNIQKLDIKVNFRHKTKSFHYFYYWFIGSGLCFIKFFLIIRLVHFVLHGHTHVTSVTELP